MTMRLSSVLGTTVLLLGVLVTAHVSAAHPNVVIIYADDLGYGDVSCYNRERGKIATPHVDRLAAAGMRFTDAHSSSGVCSPSRYTILTGRYHWRTRLQRGIVGLWGKPLIAADRLTVGTLLKRQGYVTACVGKWHLGWEWPIADSDREFFKPPPGKGEGVSATDAHRAAWQRTFSQPIAGGPISRGFDRYFGTDVPNWPPYCFIEQDRTVGMPSRYLPVPLLRRNQASKPGPALEGWTLEPILPALGDRAAKFVGEATEPFFLYMPLTSPHTPLSVNKSWIGKSGLNLYADFVMETDSIVGQVVDALDFRGVSDNTLILFTSDNGCAPYIGVKDLEEQGHFPSGRLRGYKNDVWEGGHRVPFVVRWPGVVKPATVCDQLVHQADVLATVAGVVGTKLSETAGEDSVSLLPLLRGGDVPVRETAVSQSGKGLLSMRRGNLKMIFGPGSGGWAKGRDEHPAQLYDLGNDLGEKKNLYAARPALVAEMMRAMGALVERGRSTPGADQTNDVRVNWRRFLELERANR